GRAGGVDPAIPASGASRGLGLQGPRGDDAQPHTGGALEARHAGHDAVDRRSVEHLVYEQLLGERVQLGPVGADYALGGAAGLLDQVLALLVADAKRRLGKAHVAVGRPPDAGGAHGVVVHHRVSDVGHALEVV